VFVLSTGISFVETGLSSFIELPFLENNFMTTSYYYMVRGDAYVHKTSFTLPLFIEVPVPSRKISGHIYVLDVCILPLCLQYVH